jgi:hypothetical protein
MSSDYSTEPGTVRYGNEIGRTPDRDRFILVECWSPEFGRGCRTRRWAPLRGRYNSGPHRLCEVCVKVNWRPYHLSKNHPEAVFPDD